MAGISAAGKPAPEVPAEAEYRNFLLTEQTASRLPLADSARTLTHAELPPRLKGAEVQPFGGFGSLPGATVSLSRIRPSTPLVVNSPPP